MKLSNKILIKDKNNPAFNYLLKEYSENINIYSMIADMILEASIASSAKLEDVLDIEANDDLVHFFYDLYLVLNSKLLSSKSNIVISVIIDGIHIKYFGETSLKIITSQIQLWVEKEKCYLNSFFKILKEKDFPRLLAIYAFYCISDEAPRATKALELSRIIIEIIKVVSPKIGDNINSLLNK